MIRPSNCGRRTRVALLSCLFLSTAQADPALDPLVVTATRTSQPLSATLAPTIVLDRATIEASLAADLGELLRFVAGVELARNGGPGQSTSLFLRGAESNHTLVLVDGVEINPGTIGGAALQSLPLESIERVEIVKGPRSALYGSEAIGGVINIITRRADGTRAEAAVGGGRYGAREASLGLAARAGDFDARLDLGQRRYDGYAIQTSSPIRRGNDRDSASLRLGWSSEGLGVGLRHLDSQGVTEYLDFGGAAVAQDFTTRVTALALDAQPTDALTLSLVLSRAVDDLVQRQANAFTGATDFLHSERDAAELQADLALREGHTLTLGAHRSDETADVESFGRYGADTRVTALYAQHQAQFGVHALVLALRRTDHETFGGHTAWNLDYGRPLSPRLDLTLGIGTGFHAPDATDLYSPCCGNAALEPETARQAELGLRWQASARDRVSISLHSQRIVDLITFGPSFVLENIESARVRGLELDWQRRTERWRSRIGMVVQDTADQATGLPLPRRADRQFTAALARAIGTHEVGLDLLASSARKDSSFSTLVNDGYLLANLSARLTLGPRWTLRAQLENLLDAEYTTAAGYREPGRSLSLRFAWQGD